MSVARVNQENIGFALAAVPTRSLVALEALRRCDDPLADARDVAASVEGDPALTARVMRLANSAHFGLPSQVTSARHGVVVVGFSSVRSLAALAVSGLNGHDSVPDGFWEHAARVAVGASAVAPRLGAPAADAFSAGLLHDLGEALLHRFDAAGEAGARPAEDQRAAEVAVFGLDHADAARIALEAWGLPGPFVDAVAGHHGRLAEQSPLGRAVSIGEAIALGDGARCQAAGLTRSQCEHLGRRVDAEADAVCQGLLPG
jgi:HD-like signal output (HDOD) protein